MAISDFTVQAHIGRSTGRSTPWVDLPVDLNGNFKFLLFKLIMADQLADLTPGTLPVDLNGNFRFLLLEFIWADQLADLTPPGTSASASEWQFHISTVRVLL